MTQDGIISEWNASEEILKDFINHGRMAAQARVQGDLTSYFLALESMHLDIDAFIKREHRELIEKLLAQCERGTNCAGEIPSGVMSVFTECEKMLRRAAQASKLLMKEADSWDSDQMDVVDAEENKKEVKFNRWLNKLNGRE